VHHERAERIGVELVRDVPVDDRERLLDALRMARGERRLGVDHPGEVLGDPVQTGVIAGEREVRRLSLGDVGRVERAPSARRGCGSLRPSPLRGAGQPSSPTSIPAARY
jgi:hypothetical protein